MLRCRHVLPVAVATVALTGAPAHAAGTIDDLAAEGAQLVAEEQMLVRLTDPSSTMAPSDRGELRQLLRRVDDRGTAVLAQLEQAGVEVTDAVRTALGPLPRPSGTADETVTPPPLTVYDLAGDDLRRVGDVPAAPTTTNRTGRPATLLLVALGALAVVAVALVAAVLRWRPVHRDLATMAWTDSVTGVANRQRLDHDLAVHGAAATLVTVVMVDVDHFKHVNDRFGHRTGDAVLRHVAAAIVQCVRLDDVVYRYGGEEFCVLVHGTDATRTAPMAADIRSAARRIPLPDGTGLTVSIGIADTDDRNLPDALEAADRALYAAKQAGRDRVVAAPSDERRLVPA